MASVRAHGPTAEGTLDDPRLADDAALEGESSSLTLAQRPHDLEALDHGVGCLQCLEATDRTDDLEALDHGVGCLQCLEATDRTDELLELAVVSLDDIAAVALLWAPFSGRGFWKDFEKSGVFEFDFRSV